MNLQEQKRLINEFLDYKIQGYDTACFNVKTDKELLVFDNIVGFLQSIEKLNNYTVTVLPF